MAARLFARDGRHCTERHGPLAKIRSHEGTRGPVAGLEGGAPRHPVAVLAFDSMQALRSALASRGGQAPAADRAAFAAGGAQIFFAETESA